MDPFGVLSQGDNDASGGNVSTIDDDFDALFGPIKEPERSDDEECDKIDAAAGSDVSKSDSGPDNKELGSQHNVSSTRPASSAGIFEADLLGFNDSTTSSGASQSHTSTTTDGRFDSAAKPEPKAGGQASLLDFDDSNSGLGENHSPASSLNPTQPENMDSGESFTEKKDIFDDIFNFKLPSTKKTIDDTNDLDDIFSTGKKTTEGVQQQKIGKDVSGGDATADIFATSITTNAKDDLDDFFAPFPTSKNVDPNPFQDIPAATDPAASDRHAGKDVIFGEDMFPPSSADAGNRSSDPFSDFTNSTRFPDNSDPFDPLKPDVMAEPDSRTIFPEGSSQSEVDLFANLPTKCDATDSTDSDRKPSVIGAGTEMETDRAEKSRVPDILDFLNDANVELPDVSSLEDGSSKKDDGTRVHLSSPSKQSEELMDGATEISQTADDDGEMDRNASSKVKLLVVAPSMDSEQSVKDNELWGMTPPPCKKSSKKNINTKEDKTDSAFMDFSVIAIPDAGLNVAMSKDRLNLCRKGSLALRKKPSRRAIRSSGSDGDDHIFKDSTEPRPAPAPKDEDDLEERPERSQDVLHSGDHQTTASPSPPPPSQTGDKDKHSPKGLFGGVKIPGLLEGLKKAKPFAKPDKTVDVSGQDEESRSRSPSPAVPSKRAKDSQNESIAQAIVKPSDLKKPPAGAFKLPALKPVSPADEGKPASKALPPLAKARPPLAKAPPPLAKAPPPASKAPPPVASKPSLISKPKLNPVKTPQTSSTADPSMMDTDKTDFSLSRASLKPATRTSSSTGAVTAMPKSPPTPPKSSLSPKPTPPTPPTLSVKPKPFTSPKPFTPPKPKLTAPSSSYAKPLASAKPSPGPRRPDATKARDTTDSEKPVGDNDELSNPFDSVLTESCEDKDSITDSAPVISRKSSVSGMSSVLPPTGAEISSMPRKSSISGSAYAPMGFKTALDRSLSTEDSERPRTSSSSGSDGATKCRTSSIRETTEAAQDKDETDTICLTKLDKVEEVTSSGKMGEESVKNGKAPSQCGDNRLNEKNEEKSNGLSGDVTPQKPMWGVQLRKVDKKVPPKPAAGPNKETESPVNWRQQLGNKRSSFIPKEPVAKEADDKIPEWAKASSDRRKRLMESGVIKPAMK